jgi:transcriptional regulator with XRE-family HTH domain
MPNHVGTTMARRQLGRRLRRLRVEAGKTLDDVAEAHLASLTKMWRVETGRTSAKTGDVLALARFYGLTSTATEELLELAAATRGTGFQQDKVAGISEWGGMYGELEAAASTVRDYNCQLVPGLLQIPDYVRAVTVVNRSLDPNAVERRITFRAQRQRAFFDRPVPGRLDAVLTAGVLELVVGSPVVMAAQHAHLREMATRDNVTVRVLSAVNGVHAGMRGDFVIMDFADDDDPTLVYLESLIGSRYLERPEHVAVYRDAFDRIVEQAVPLEDYHP